jgi:hypothetical protein
VLALRGDLSGVLDVEAAQGVHAQPRRAEGRTGPALPYVHVQRQVREVERFGEVIVGAGFQGGQHVGTALQGGEDEHHGGAQGRLGAQALQDGEAIQAREQEVEQKGTVVPPPQEVQGLRAIGGDGDLMPRVLQGQAQRLAHVRIIVHHQDVVSGPRGAPFGRGVERTGGPVERGAAASRLG